MNLKTCLSIAKDCGLTTIGEAYLNIKYHAISIFSYDDINKEMKELADEINELSNKGPINTDTLIDEYLKENNK